MVPLVEERIGIHTKSNRATAEIRSANNMKKLQSAKVVLSSALALLVFIIFVFNFINFKSDKESHFEDIKGYISLQSIPRDMQKSDAVDFIDSLAEKYHVNLYLENNGETNGGKSTTLYSFGTFNSEAVSKQFQAFDPSWKFDIKSSQDIEDKNLGGTYLTNAQKGAISNIVDELKAKEIKCSYKMFDSKLSVANFIYSVLMYHTQLLIVVFFMLLFFAISYYILSQSKKHSIFITGGYTAKNIFFHELKTILLSFLKIGFIMSILFVVFLFFYNKCTMLKAFLVSQFVYYLLLALFITVFVAILVKLISIKNNAYEFIKEKHHLGILNFISIISQIILTFSIILSVNSNMLDFMHLRDDSREYAEFANVKTYDSFVFGLGIVFEEHAADDIGSFIKKLDENNRVLLINRKACIDNDHDACVLSEINTNSVTVNSTYFETQSIKGENGEDIKVDRNSKPTLLIPQSRQNERDFIKSNVITHLNGQSDKKNQYEKYADSDLNIVQILDGQTINTYNNGRDYNNDFNNPSSIMRNCVILVIPDVSKMLDNHYLESYASKSQIYVDNKDGDLSNLVKENGMQKYITSINNVTDMANAKFSDYIAKASLILFINIMALLLLIFITVVLSLIYYNLNQKEIFIKHTSGYNFLQINYRFIAKLIGVLLLAGIFSFYFILSVTSILVLLLLIALNVLVSVVLLQKLLRVKKGQ
ncbi:MAG: DUF1430 domain-containing protein [Candidatus Ancillula sp.]|jgi:hypothetical protein|nr:DUF1430 domain-containing protein [Candidatus Ancillula sp.]